jgi:hypothetical protein
MATGRTGRCLRPFLVLASVALAACGSSTSAPAAIARSTTSVNPAATTTTIGPGPGPATSTSSPHPTTTNASPTTGPPVDGTGVRGHVTAGPTCPVERADQPCPPRPVVGRVDALDGSGHVAGSASTDDAGAYVIALRPGDYTLRVGTGGQYPRCPDTPVTVPAGPPATADISCDTGIR